MQRTNYSWVVMRLNWKRGMVRIWIVLSLLWLAVANGAVLLVFSEQQERIAQPTVNEHARWNEAEPASRNYHIETIEYIRVFHMPPWPILAVIISLPVAVFGIGVIVYWVALGFRRQG